MKWMLERGKLLSHVGWANNWVTIAALVRIGIKFNERCDVTQFLYMGFFFFFFVHCLNNCIHDYDTSISMSLLIIRVSLCYLLQI